MTRADVIVVGGGIAGLSVACHLARLGIRRVLLIEREPLLASHSTGRNAAIFRPLDETPGVTARGRCAHKGFRPRPPQGEAPIRRGSRLP